MTAEAERTLAERAGRRGTASAMAALAREEAADYGTPEELAQIWNDMAPRTSRSGTSATGLR
jgi:hypothetical protein